MSEKHIVISINTSWNIYNFRADLIRALQAGGYRVTALAPKDAYSDRLRDLGCDYVPIEMDNKGTSPLRDLQLLLAYRRRLRKLRADAFLSFTPKPNIWGALAAQSLGIPTVQNISGLGTAFLQKGALQRLVILLYRLALRRAGVVFFQNKDDRALFEDLDILASGRARLLPGSGIDLNRFSQPPARPFDGDRARFLLVARLIADKGVREFVDAARRVRQSYPEAWFGLLGFLDVANRSAMSRAEVDAWQAEGLIDYLGETDDVRPHLATADCVVLPSYREGTPRSLLEAAAMGRPLIATDVPGCREVVAPGRNGYLVEVRDADALAQAMVQFCALSPEAYQDLADGSRRLAVETFDMQIVHQAYLDALAEMLDEG